MSDKPSDVHVRHLERAFGNLPIRPAHVRRLEDESLEVSVAGYRFVFVDADRVESLLNDLMDVDDSMEQDETEDAVVELLDRFGSE